MKNFLRATALHLALAACTKTPPPTPNKVVTTETVESAREKAAQAILDHPEFDKHFHPEIPGRAPLAVSSEQVGSNMALRKFGRWVVFDTRDQILEPHVRFNRLSCTSNYCNASFEYRTESVIGSCGVGRGEDGIWKVEKWELKQVGTPRSRPMPKRPIPTVKIDPIVVGKITYMQQFVRDFDKGSKIDILARETDSGRELWRTTILSVVFETNLAPDLQELHLKSLALKNGILVALDENETLRRIDASTGQFLPSGP